MRVLERSLIRSAMTAAMLLVAVPAAWAQLAALAPDGAKGLTEGDFDLLMRATHAINHSNLLRPGQSRSWTNPESGARGEIAFVRAGQSDGLSCHQLRSTIYVADRAEPGVQDLNWCLTPSGAWKIKG